MPGSLALQAAYLLSRGHHGNFTNNDSDSDSDDDDDKHDHSLSKTDWIVIGVSIFIFVFLLCLVGSWYLYLRHRERMRRQSLQAPCAAGMTERRSESDAESTRNLASAAASISGRRESFGPVPPMPSAPTFPSGVESPELAYASPLSTRQPPFPSANYPSTAQSHMHYSPSHAPLAMPTPHAPGAHRGMSRENTLYSSTPESGRMQPYYQPTAYHQQVAFDPEAAYGAEAPFQSGGGRETPAPPYPGHTPPPQDSSQAEGPRHGAPLARRSTYRRDPNGFFVRVPRDEKRRPSAVEIEPPQNAAHPGCSTEEPPSGYYVP